MASQQVLELLQMSSDPFDEEEAVKTELMTGNAMEDDEGGGATGGGGGCKCR